MFCSFLSELSFFVSSSLLCSVAIFPQTFSLPLSTVTREGADRFPNRNYSHLDVLIIYELVN